MKPSREERPVEIDMQPSVGQGGGVNGEGCGWFRHNWVYIGDPMELDGGGCCSYALRYRCRDCGKTKDRGGA